MNPYQEEERKKEAEKEELQNIYKIEIEEGSLYVDIEKVKVSDIILNRWASHISRADNYLSIPMYRNFIKTLSAKAGDIELGDKTWLHDPIRLPRFILLGFVPKDNYYGSPSTNPFLFKRLDFRNASLVRENFYEPLDPYDTGKSATSKKALQLFYKQLAEIGHHYQAGGFNTPLTKEGYESNQFFLAFDRSSNKDNGHFPVKTDTGTLGLNLELREALTEDMVIVAYISYDSELRLYSHGVESSVY